MERRGERGDRPHTAAAWPRELDIGTPRPRPPATRRRRPRTRTAWRPGRGAQRSCPGPSIRPTGPPSGCGRPVGRRRCRVPPPPGRAGRSFPRVRSAHAPRAPVTSTSPIIDRSADATAPISSTIMPTPWPLGGSRHGCSWSHGSPGEDVEEADVAEVGGRPYKCLGMCAQAVPEFG